MAGRTYLTPKEEALSVKYIELGSQVGAYREVYGTGEMTERTLHKRTGDAFRRPHVRARIQELRDQVARESVVSRSWVVAELVKVYDTAMGEDGRNLAAANRALELMGTELGMFVKRRVVAHLENMTEEDLVEFLGGEPSVDELEQAARTLARLGKRRSVDARRGADRDRPHRNLVQFSTARHRAGRYRPGEGPRRRNTDRGLPRAWSGS